MKYSIITINFNNCDGLRKTIESVVNQTFQNFEYIIIDGGSTDGSVEVIKEYADRIAYWVSEPDKGIYNAMNKGILKAHGEYLNFMNSGDCFYNNDVLKEILPHLTANVIFGKAYIEHTNSYWAPQPPMTLFSFCLYGFNHQSTFYKKELFNNNQYDENYKLIADWKFTVMQVVLEQATYKCVDTVVANYDLTGISTQNRNIAVEERNMILTSLFPSGIAEDYMFFAQLKTPLLKDIPFWVKHHSLHRLIIKLINITTCMYMCIYKIFKRKH